MLYPRRGGKGARRLLLSLLLLAIWKAGSGQVHYSIQEEAKHGTFVGRIAQDLGLELAELVPRLFRVASKDHGDLLEVNLQNGILFVNSRIDREELYTGEISTTRALDEADAPRQRLLVLVKDHGEPALMATATVLLSLVENSQAPKTSSQTSPGAAKAEAALVDVNVYLIIAICAVSSLLVLSLLLYTALRCSAPPTEGACGPGKPVLVCSSAVGSWSYSQQRRQRVCSGEGPPKTDLMAFSPSLPPGPNMSEENEHPEVNSEHSGNPRQPNPDWRYSASLRAGMHSSVHLEEAGILRAGPGGSDQQWPTVSSATPEPEAGEVSPPVGAGVNSNSWTFKYGPGNPKQSGPGELPDKFIIPGSPAIISIRQEPTNSQIDKSDFITFGKKEETKKKKKKKKGNKTQEKKEKGNSTTDNSDQ
uniref:Cadherin domain-containing protein n=1 Tax=Myotis myotis TaxID=51298 RepID=A0A7J7XH96_MYOMY|nr:hypothetical protein mMyoMyo1_011648 [Myotis myotis]